MKTQNYQTFSVTKNKSNRKTNQRNSNIRPCTSQSENVEKT